MSVTTGQSGPGPQVRTLGDFELLEEIGRGGMGVVYRARQISMDRMVALKLLPRIAGADPEAVVRFHREAESAGRVAHPGIVPIYAVGEADDTHYFAMELIDGPSIARLLESLQGSRPQELQGSFMEETAMTDVYSEIREQPLPAFLANARYPASCAAIALEIVGALNAAHENQVIHRDLKPSNVLMHPDGRIVLVDFGLARDETAEGVTRSGDAVGTPSYMAPEQAAGFHDLDCRVDVYGVGATLYEMLTMRPPFDGAHSAEIMQKILDVDPAPVRDLNARVPRDLETIVLCCLAKDPARRYPDMAHLARDLRSFLAGEPIVGRRPGLQQRLRRYFTRNRRSTFVLAAALFFALFVGLMVGLVSLNVSRQSGRDVLLEARDHLIQGDAMAAHATYGQALGLLDDARLVATERLRHFSAAFEKLYEGGQRDVLRTFLAALPADERDRTEYRAFARRLDGFGVLRLNESIRGNTFVRGLVDGDLEPKWRPLPTDGQLPIGSYLVVVRGGGAPKVVRTITIERDRDNVLPALPKLVGAAPPGTCVFLAADGHALLAIDRTEFTRGAYAALLESVPSVELRAELTPPRFDGKRDPYRPMTNISFRQARTAAALLGRHLPTKDEYRQAATAGFPGMAFPWGMRFDTARVVADPARITEPLAADSLAEGASVHGALHLVGNVAEFLAPDRDGRLFIAGGHWLSAPDAARADAKEAIRNSSQRGDHFGFRMCKFLVVNQRASLGNAHAERMRELWSNARPHRTTRWRLTEDGRMLVEAKIVPATTTEVKRWPGFLTVGASKIVSDQARTRIVARLQPTRALVAHGAGYRLCLPLEVTPGVASLTELLLPSGCVVDLAWPSPSLVFEQDGQRLLLWESNANGTAVVLLRRDGMLTGEWPTSAPVERAARSYLAALGKRGIKPGLPWLADKRIEHVRLVDVVAVGDVVTADVRVDLRSIRQGAGDMIPGFELQVAFQRGRGELKVLGAWPRLLLDGGEVRGQSYHNNALNLRFAWSDDVRCEQLAEHVATMQLRCRPRDRTGVELIVLGDRVVGHRSLAWERLVSTSLAGRQGQQEGSRVDLVGAETGSRHMGQSQHWLLREGDLWVWERWTRLQIGNRLLLLRARTWAKTRVDARRAFGTAEPWFARALAGLELR